MNYRKSTLPGKLRQVPKSRFLGTDVSFAAQFRTDISDDEPVHFVADVAEKHGAVARFPHVAEDGDCREIALECGEDVVDVGKERQLFLAQGLRGSDQCSINRIVRQVPDFAHGGDTPRFDAAVEVAELLDAEGSLFQMKANISR